MIAYYRVSVSDINLDPARMRDLESPLSNAGNIPGLGDWRPYKGELAWLGQL